MRHVLAGAVFGCLLIGGSVHAQDLFQRTSDEAAVRKMWQDYVAVWNTHDAKALATFLTEDADRLANGSVAKGRAAVQQAFADTDKNATLSSVQVSVRFLTRDVAILDARDEVRRIEKAGVSISRTNHTSILLRQNGRWVTAAIRAWTLPAPAVAAK